MNDKRSLRKQTEDLSDRYLQKYLSELKAGNHNAALEKIKELLEISPLNFKAYYYRANLLLLYKDCANAVKDYDECLKLNPEFGEAYINRGFTKKIMGDIDGSYSDFEHAKRLGYFE